MTMKQATEEYRKIVRARAGLILEHPFFASLTLRMTLREDKACETAWSDGAVIGYNPLYIKMLPIDKLKGLMGHVAMHPACRHHIRRKGRNPKLWNMACDYAINWILLEAGLELPDGYLDNPEFRDKTADEIYSFLSSKMDKNQQGEHLDSSSKDTKNRASEQQSDDVSDSKPNNQQKDKEGQSDQQNFQSSSGEEQPEKARKDEEIEQGDPGKAGEVRDAPFPHDESSSLNDSPENEKEQEKEWKIALSQAVSQAKSMGDFPASLERMVNQILSPKLDWRDLLGRFISASARSDYAWMPPNLRYLHLGLYLPSLRSDDLPEVVIAVPLKR